MYRRCTDRVEFSISAQPNRLIQSCLQRQPGHHFGELWEDHEAWLEAVPVPTHTRLFVKMRMKAHGCCKQGEAWLAVRSSCLVRAAHSREVTVVGHEDSVVLSELSVIVPPHSMSLQPIHLCRSKVIEQQRWLRGGRRWRRRASKRHERVRRRGIFVYLGPC